jgi:hypothetical protein
VQRDALLSPFFGVVSGFDLGDEVDLRSLGFGSSSSGNGGGPANAGVGHILSLALLGQYAAAFSAGEDGSLVTDTLASGYVTPSPLVASHS